MTDRCTRVYRSIPRSIEDSGLLRPRLLRAALLVLSFTTIPWPARADVVAAINEARLRGCGASSPVKLRESSRLNDAARRLSRGDSIQEATGAASYRALNSAALHITNVPDDRDVERIVARQFCR